MSVLETMLSNQRAALAACQSDTSVEYESDPNYPGRTIIRIAGPTRHDVQRQINKVMNAIEDVGGFANFLGPKRNGAGYLARGETIVEQMAQAAE